MKERTTTTGTGRKFVFSCPRMKFSFSSYSLWACLSSIEWKLKLLFESFTFLPFFAIFSSQNLSSKVFPQFFINTSSSHLHVRQLSPFLTSISIFLSSPTKFSSLPIFSCLDSFSTVWCEHFYAIWLVFLANFLNFAITLGECHCRFFWLFYL